MPWSACVSGCLKKAGRAFRKPKGWGWHLPGIRHQFPVTPEGSCKRATAYLGQGNSGPTRALAQHGYGTYRLVSTTPWTRTWVSLESPSGQE